MCFFSSFIVVVFYSVFLFGFFDLAQLFSNSLMLYGIRSAFFLLLRSATLYENIDLSIHLILDIPASCSWGLLRMDRLATFGNKSVQTYALFLLGKYPGVG